MTEATAAREIGGKESGSTTITRYVAECDYPTCQFNARKDPTLYRRPEEATKEARTHGALIHLEAHLLGAREVHVRRVRRVVSEEIV